jgi:acyl carrier protein
MSEEALSTLDLVLAAFRAALGIDLRPDDDFFEAGGDSVSAEAVLMKLEEATGLTLPGWTLLDNPTAARLATLLDEGLQIW